MMGYQQRLWNSARATRALASAQVLREIVTLELECPE